MQTESPELYRQYKDFVAAALMDRDGQTFEALVQQQIDLYAGQTRVALSREMEEDEVVANAAEMFLTDEESVRRLCEDNRTLGQKFLDLIRQVIRKIQKALSGAEVRQEATRLLAEDLDTLQQAETLWTRMLGGEKEEAYSGKGKEYAEGEGKRYQLEPYSEHQKENWAGSRSIVLYENEAQLARFIEGALAHKLPGKKMYFGRIPSDLAVLVKTETGLDIEGYNCTLRSDEVEKILLHSHGNDSTETLRGQRAITKEDFFAIPEIIQSPDRIEASQELYEGKLAIRFIKTINGRTTVVTYVSKKHHDLVVQTMYAGRKKESLATAGNAPQDAAPTLTPEANIGTAFKSSILQTEDTVKEETRYQMESGDESPAVQKLLRENARLKSAVELSPQNRRGGIMNYAVIASAYPKSAVQSLIDTSDILYIDPDKKEPITGYSRSGSNCRHE